MSDSDERLRALLRDAVADAQRQAPRFDAGLVIAEAERRRPWRRVFAGGRTLWPTATGQARLLPRFAIVAVFVLLAIGGVILRVTRSSGPAGHLSAVATTTSQPVGPPTTIVPPPTTTSRPPPSSVPPTSSTSTTTSTSTVPLVTACVTGQVTVSTDGDSAGMGTLAAEYLVHNSAATACSIDGYPLIAPYGPAGGTAVKRLSVNVVPTTNFSNISGGGGLVVLPAGGSAAFLLVSTDVNQPGGCVTWSGFYFGTPASGSSSELQVPLIGPGLLCGGTLDLLGMYPPSTKISLFS